MKSAPNRTIVSGRVRGCKPAPDGFGGELELEVIANETPDARTDFIRPAVGQALRAFYGELDARIDTATLLGQRVRVQLTFLGGPRGGRVVVQKLDPVG